MFYFVWKKQTCLTPKQVIRQRPITWAIGEDSLHSLLCVTMIFCMYINNRKFYAIYEGKNRHFDKTIGNKVSQSSLNLRAPRGTDVLAYWRLYLDVYSALAKTAITFLDIAENTPPFNSLFDKAQNVLDPHHTYMASISVEVLLFLKQWYCVFGPLFVVDPNMEILLCGDSLDLVPIFFLLFFLSPYALWVSKTQVYRNMFCTP